GERRGESVYFQHEPVSLLPYQQILKVRAGFEMAIEREASTAVCFSQVEYCDNLIFHRRAAVDQLTERLLDMNRGVPSGSGQPKKITMIFGRKVTKEYKGKLQTVIEDLDLPNPVIRRHYGHGFAKQYVRDDRLLRTEPA